MKTKYGIGILIGIAVLAIIGASVFLVQFFSGKGDPMDPMDPLHTGTQSGQSNTEATRPSDPGTSPGTDSDNNAMKIVQMLTNGVNNPVAVDRDLISFSWELTSGRRGAMQSAYSITVKEKSTGTQVWDSGKIVSDKSAGILYAGPELSAAAKYLVELHVWDENGEECEAYTGAFGTGLEKSDWTADFIWDNEQNINDYVYFRKSFTLSKDVAQATVFTSAHNDYQLWLNGEFVGVGPARSDPYSYGQYCAYDITSMLQKGDNSFAALAHWHGAWSDSGVNAKPAYILEARITYTDGTTDSIKTDTTWKMSETPYVEENFVGFGHYGGVNNRASIRYDAGREQNGWNTTVYDDSAWGSAVKVTRRDYNLYAQLVSEEKENERVSPVSVTKKGNSYIVDFGKCLTGWPSIALHGNAAGSEVKVQYWEVEKGWGDAGYDTYIAKGGEEIFYAPFVRHTSFRILEITGYSGTLTAEDVVGIVAYSEAQVLGKFTSSDERLNLIYEMCERSGRQNIQQGIVSVDANREQSPWTADSWNVGIGILYNQKNTMLIDKIIKDYAAEQQRDGNFLTCSPARDYTSTMAEWSLYWPMLLWEQYSFSGDTALLEKYYPNFTKFWAYIETYKSNATGLYNPPGWRASDYAGGSLENGGENIATNCQIYMVLGIAEKIAKLVAPDDAAKYRSAAEELCIAINTNLLAGGEKYYTSTTSRQTHPLGTAWALRAGVVPDLFYDRVVEWFASQKVYDVGGYGGDALYNGLYTAGLGHIAVSDFARYDNMLSANRTNWESFGELSIDNMGNHAWTAYPAYLLPKYVGGISPSEGGFAAVEIKPVIGGLTYASAAVPTVKGQIEVSWTKVSDSKFTLTVKVPANVKAYICLPYNDMANVTVSESGVIVYENGSYRPGQNGILSGEAQKDSILFTTRSGEYSFEITGTPKNSPVIGEEKPVSGVILDDGDAKFSGNWVYETASNINDRYGDGFRYASGSATATASATYTHTVQSAGKYSIYAMWGVHTNRATNTPFTIKIGEKTQTIRMNQEKDGGRWNLLGSYDVAEGETITVIITNDADEYVIADAIRIAPYAKSDDGLTSAQRLQLKVYEMLTVSTKDCTSDSAVKAFEEAIARASALCANANASEGDLTTAMETLLKAHEALLDNSDVNLALGKSVTASEQVSASGVWGSEYLTDGYIAKDNNGKVGYTSKAYNTKQLSIPITLTLDLGSIESFNQIILYPRVGSKAWNGKTANFPADYTVEVSSDGESFRTILNVTDQEDPNFEAVVLDLSLTEARYVRISVTKLGEYAGDEQEPGKPTPYRLQLSEIEIRKSR